MGVGVATGRDKAEAAAHVSGHPGCLAAGKENRHLPLGAIPGRVYCLSEIRKPLERFDRFSGSFLIWLTDPPHGGGWCREAPGGAAAW